MKKESLIMIQRLLKSIDSSLYPKDHQLGLVVPVGGSSCSKCKWIKPDNNCSNKSFQEWNNDSSKLPASANKYCCDLFQTK